MALLVPVGTGTYDGVGLAIHKPENDSVDQAITAAPPTWPATASVRVTGRFNSKPFAHPGTPRGEQKLEPVPPLAVSDAAGPVNVTIRVDASA